MNWPRTRTNHILYSSDALYYNKVSKIYISHNSPGKLWKLSKVKGNNFPKAHIKQSIIKYDKDGPPHKLGNTKQTT